jgi:hypothetical protein
VRIQPHARPPILLWPAMAACAAGSERACEQANLLMKPVRRLACLAVSYVASSPKLTAIARTIAGLDPVVHAIVRMHESCHVA